MAEPLPPGAQVTANAIPTKRASYQPLTTRLRPRLSTIFVAALLVAIGRSNTIKLPAGVSFQVAKWAVIGTAIANWRAIPFYWTVITTAPSYKREFRKLLLGRKVDQAAVGKDIFQAVASTSRVASWNACDFFLHMSNSSYPYALDEARFTWALRYLGALMDHEGVLPMLAANSVTFFNEIPMLAKYKVEGRTVAWDHKWVYYLCRFTTAPPKGSHERTLNAIAIGRLVLKVGRRTASPGRVFSLAGFGLDSSNYGRALTLRAKGKGAIKDWLFSSEGSDGLETFEAKRKANLDIIRRALDGTAGADALKDLWESDL